MAEFRRGGPGLGLALQQPEAVSDKDGPVEGGPVKKMNK